SMSPAAITTRRLTPGLLVGTAIALGLALCAFSTTVRAQENKDEAAADTGQEAGAEEAGVENAYVFSPVTVTANRSERSLFDTPANVSRIATEELDRRMDDTVEEIFRYEPGIIVPRQVSAADPFDSAGGIQIRGAGGNRT